MVVDIRTKVDDTGVQELLALCMGDPTPQRLQAVSARYCAQPTWHLLGIEAASAVIACIGLEMIGPGEAAIRCIAVAAPYRRQELGRRLVQASVQQFGLHRLVAETDSDAVGFYERCGFVITSLGELYPGRERFHCLLTGTT